DGEAAPIAKVKSEPTEPKSWRSKILNDEPAKPSKRAPKASRDHGMEEDLDFEEDFADDENPDFGIEDREEAEEARQRQFGSLGRKSQMLEDDIDDSDEEEIRAPVKGEKKKLTKTLKKVDVANEYESGDEENPYLSEEDEEEQDEAEAEQAGDEKDELEKVLEKIKKPISKPDAAVAPQPSKPTPPVSAPRSGASSPRAPEQPAVPVKRAVGVERTASPAPAIKRERSASPAPRREGSMSPPHSQSLAGGARSPLGAGAGRGGPSAPTRPSGPAAIAEKRKRLEDDDAGDKKRKMNDEPPPPPTAAEVLAAQRMKRPIAAGAPMKRAGSASPLTGGASSPPSGSTTASPATSQRKAPVSRAVADARAAAASPASSSGRVTPRGGSATPVGDPLANMMSREDVIRVIRTLENPTVQEIVMACPLVKRNPNNKDIIRDVIKTCCSLRKDKEGGKTVLMLNSEYR
ncbi:hypothetical protein BDK51DRAFT_34264, partial [Blyttiomyces helicus]